MHDKNGWIGVLGWLSFLICIIQSLPFGANVIGYMFDTSSMHLKKEKQTKCESMTYFDLI